MAEWPEVLENALGGAVRHFEEARLSIAAGGGPGELAPAVRALTRLWAEANPDFDSDAFYAVSFMITEHWDRISAEIEDSERSTAATRRMDEAIALAGPERLRVVTALCQELASDPLFASRELFHSNLLAWFADTFPDVAREVFGPWTHPDPAGKAAPTERERRNLDLIIRMDGMAPLVIENKMFSPPDDSQLSRYADAVSKVNPAADCVLLAPTNPGWSNDVKRIEGITWRHRSYADLAEALDRGSDRIPGGYENLYARETIRRYARGIRIVANLVSICADLDEESSVAIPDELREALDLTRLRGSFAKARAYAVAKAIDPDGATGIKSGVTRGNPLIEWFTALPGTLDQVGWQFQDGQWRLAVKVGAPDDGNSKGAEAKRVRQRYVESRYASWFDFRDAERGFSASPHPAEGWCDFAPNFVYRYVTAGTGVTVGDLAALHQSTSRRADELIAGRAASLPTSGH